MTQTNQTPQPQPHPCYKRTSDQLVSVQLMGTVFAIVVGIFSFQYQTGRIISEVTATIATQNTEIESLQEDIKELKLTIKELTRQ